VLQLLLKVSEVEAEIVVDQERVRTVDIPELTGSAAKAQKEVGWRPRIELESTLNSVFTFWLERLSKGPS
jgi:GDP-D-mannose dehydratase